MPVYDPIDGRAVKEEARSLLRTARVSPIRMTALLLAVTLVLDLIDAAVSSLTGGGLDVLSFSFSFVSILILLLSMVLSAGFSLYCLGVQRGEALPYTSLFDAFPFAGKVVLLRLLEAVIVFVLTVAFIIPGIVLALAYSFALYHLCEDPGLGVIEAMRRSRREMDGYKMQLFLLLLSFLPLLFLFATPVSLCQYYLRDVFPQTLAGTLLRSLVFGLLTALASLYVTPYLSLARAVFYRRVTEPRGTPAAPGAGDDDDGGNDGDDDADGYDGDSGDGGNDDSDSSDGGSGRIDDISGGGLF